jgi:PilZ domain-containing protein
VPPYSTPEGRHSKRNAAKERASLIVNLENRREKISCLIIDISQEGFRLRGISRQLKRGQAVELNPSEGPLYVRCRVMWVGRPGSKQDGEAGLQLLLNPFLDSRKG